MSGETLQVGGDDAMRIKSDGVVVAAPSDACCCTTSTTCVNCNAGIDSDTIPLEFADVTICSNQTTLLGGGETLTTHVGGGINGSFTLTRGGLPNDILDQTCTWGYSEYPATTATLLITSDNPGNPAYPNSDFRFEIALQKIDSETFQLIAGFCNPGDTVLDTLANLYLFLGTVSTQVNRCDEALTACNQFQAGDCAGEFGGGNTMGYSGGGGLNGGDPTDCPNHCPADCVICCQTIKFDFNIGSFQATNDPSAVLCSFGASVLTGQIIVGFLNTIDYGANPCRYRLRIFKQTVPDNIYADYEANGTGSGCPSNNPARWMHTAGNWTPAPTIDNIMLSGCP
jgi:hypothetical protein